MREPCDEAQTSVETAGMNREVLAHVRSAFEFGDAAEMTVSAGSRGALGQIWRIEAGTARYALKEIFPKDDEPPSPALIEAEVDFGRLAAAGGVRLPASHPDRHGRYLVPMPSGSGWLRLYDWLELRPVDMSVASAPARLGVLLAQLHRCARPAAREPGGGGPDAWYDRTPSMRSWTPVVAVALTSGAGWADSLAERVAMLPVLCSLVVPADPATMLMCHRDLHPENVLADSDGELVVVDWDNLGPAEPGRELAGMLFDWFHDGVHADIDAMHLMYEAYSLAGGPGRIRRLADFSMLVAGRVNFLQAQVGVAISPEAEERHRDWAVREIEEALRILPTPRTLADVLDMARRSDET